MPGTRQLATCFYHKKRRIKLQNAKCDLGKLDDFQLLSEEQFKKPKVEPPVSPKESGKRLPQLPDDNAEVEIVESLPVNFDVLARKRYEKICAISVR